MTSGTTPSASRIPVFSEKPVIHKEIVVTSEVVIDRRLAIERQTLEETLRRATVTIDDNTAPWEPVRRHLEGDGTPGADRGGAVHPVGRTNPDEEGDAERVRQADIHRRA